MDAEYQAYARQALALAKLPPRAKILDVGAGLGALSLQAVQPPHHHQVWAVDYAEGMLKQLEARADEELSGEQRKRLHVAQMDGQDLQLDINSFDAAFAMFSLIFFPDRIQGLREMHRVIKPNGVAVVTSWGNPKKHGVIRRNNQALVAVNPNIPRPATVPPAFSLSDPAVFESEMKASGFVDVEIVPVVENFVIDDPGQFWDHMRYGFPGVNHLLNNYYNEQQVQQVRSLFVSKLRSEFAGQDRIFLSAEALVGIGRKRS